LSASQHLDLIDKLVLNALQDDFPIHPRPWLVLAERLAKEKNLALTETQLLERVNSLKRRGYIRRLGAIFNSKPLGFCSTLCAAQVPAELFEPTTKFINDRDEVTHNYERDHEINVWFTFCHNSRKQLESFLAQLRAIKGLDRVIDLPAQKVYKIKAIFTLPVY
jgi:DNA-binding Lrp family transcriptional regulator